MNVSAYFERIGYTGPKEPTAETLRRIHRAHMLAVPFENLDIGLGRRIMLEQEASVRKIVVARRGGFCYELNGAFAALLETLGFEVTMLSARVRRADGSESPEFDHLALRVVVPEGIEQVWLADVGFGDSFLEPLQLQVEREQRQGRCTFRIVEYEGRLLLERRPDGGSTEKQYIFTLQPHRLEEFAGMCHYHQTSPDSSFTQKRVCSLATQDGRVTLSGLKLIVTRGGDREEQVLASEDEWHAALENRFGVVL